jgi:hypothetical protein
MLYSMYPAPVKRWISARGGLTPKMIFLRGKALQALYKPCYLDAQASANKPVPASATSSSSASSSSVSSSSASSSRWPGRFQPKTAYCQPPRQRRGRHR